MSNEDRKVIIERLRASGASSTSLKRLRGFCPDWSSERLNAAIEALEAERLLKPMGSSSTHFGVDEELLKSINLDPPATVENAKPEDEAEEANSDGAIASPSVVTPPVPPVPVPAPEPQKKTRLMSLMDKLALVTPPKILGGEEREARIAKIFESCVDKIVEIDEAIQAISDKFPMFVDGDKDRIYIVRVTPETGSDAPGGLKMTYSPPDKRGQRRERVLLELPWPRSLTENGGGWIIKKVENTALGVVSRMTAFIEKHASKI